MLRVEAHPRRFEGAPDYAEQRLEHRHGIRCHQEPSAEIRQRRELRIARTDFALGIDEHPVGGLGHSLEQGVAPSNLFLGVLALASLE